MIPVAGVSLSSHRYGHLTTHGGLGWETLMGLPGEIDPTAGKFNLEAGGKEL